MRHAIRAVLTLASVTVLSTSAAAQSGQAIELGMDAGVAFGLEDPSTTVIGLPVQSFRVGFFASDMISIEPSVGFNYIKADGGDAFTTFDGNIGLVFHFSADRSRMQPYVRPYGGLTRLSLLGESVNQGNLGAGIGLKLPIADRLATRLEATYAHAFETDELPDSNAIGLSLGLSFFTR